jgi:tRNA pseudouridine38-40 synthase
MVRSLVAMSIEVGRGRVEPDEVARILEARDRRVAKGAAPARGLTLVAVGYD